MSLFPLGILSAAGASAGFAVEYLVIAGGGGGATSYGAGAGAGGFRTNVVGQTSGGGSSAESEFLAELGPTFTVTVGAGGSGGLYSPSIQATNGNNSVFDSITSLGGGRGSGFGQAGFSGGSGGGGNNFSPGAAGTANQGFAGGTVTSQNRPGGGGGAGAVGGAPASGTVGGNGGVGVSSDITGTATFRGGGGAGGGISGGNTGGNGGGGNRGTAGTINTGGGAGGTRDQQLGPSGGSGIVILRYPSNLTITIGAGLTGSTATVGGNKVTTITAGTGNVSWAA